jgi:hypothetical protein
VFAVAPLLLLHGSTNWDLVAMALAGLGLLQWARRRPLAAGLLLGAATATKLYPVLFLVPLLALCLRAGRLRAFGSLALATVLTPVLLSLPVYLVSPSFAEVGGVQTVVAGSPLDRLGDEGLSAVLPKTDREAPDGTPVTGVNAAYRFFELNTTRPPTGTRSGTRCSTPAAGWPWTPPTARRGGSTSRSPSASSRRSAASSRWRCAPRAGRGSCSCCS